MMECTPESGHCYSVCTLWPLPSKQREERPRKEDDVDHESCVSCPGGGGGAKTASAKKGGLFTDFFPFLRFIWFIFSMSYTAKHFRVKFGTFKSLNIKEKQEKLYLLFSQVCAV